MLSSPQVLHFAGCSYRQLDYWVRTGVIEPERAARGSGSRRLFTERQAHGVRMVADLAALGAPSGVLRGAFAYSQRLTEWTGLMFVDDEGTLTRNPPGGSCWAVDLDQIAGREAWRRELISA